MVIWTCHFYIVVKVSPTRQFPLYWTIEFYYEFKKLVANKKEKINKTYKTDLTEDLKGVMFTADS